MLDPQARALLQLMAAKGVPPTHTLTPPQARAVYRERRFSTQPDPVPVAEVRALAAPGPAGPIPLRLYRPAHAPQPAPLLVYYHGGGWVIGDLDTHDSFCRVLADQAGCAVVAVDYRLGPEARFPAAVDDALAATRWLHAQAAALGFDAARIAIGGDSAGGNLAAVVALALRDEREAAPASDPPTPAAPAAPAAPATAVDTAVTPATPSTTAPTPTPSVCRPLLQLLIYPATDMRCVAPSHRSNGQGYLLTADTLAWFRGHYLDADQQADWRASPLLAARHDGLPPALVLTAGHDPLRDEGLQYADALSAAGVPTQYLCFERQIHGFILMSRVLDEARTAQALCAQALRQAFGAAPGAA